MGDLAAAMGQLVTEVGQSITSAETVSDVKAPLRCLVSLLFDSNAQQSGIGDEDCQGAETSNLTSVKCFDEIAKFWNERASLASPGKPSGEVMRDTFYEGPCFAAVAKLLLQKVAVDWLACFSSLEQNNLFDTFFTSAPLNEAVSVLVHGLRLELSPEDDDGGTVNSLSGARLQAERLLFLLLISRQGIKGLATLCSSSLTKSQNSGGKAARYQQEGSYLAQLLSTLPERVSKQAPKDLQAPFYIESIVSQLLLAAEENWTHRSTESSSYSETSASGETQVFVGEVIGKLCRRGHAGTVARQIAPSLLQHVRNATNCEIELAECQRSQSSWAAFTAKLQWSIWPSLIASIRDSYALERFSEALIREMASKPDVTDIQAYLGLLTLYGMTFVDRATTRNMFTETFLFRKIFPTRCLKWILDFAVICSPPTSDKCLQTGKHEKKSRTDVVRQLAEGWAMKEFVQSASVQRQAYSTAALGMCLGSIERDLLKATNALIPSLLKGISNRLESPLSPVRLMAKKIALAFSILLDPEKPLLFDKEDSVEDLLNWNGLNELINPTTRVSKRFSEVKQIVGPEGEKERSDRAQVDNQVNHIEQRIERHRRRKPSQGKRFLVEDDPDAIVTFGERRLDGESEQSSDSDSESDSSLQPYDMSDEEADVGRKEFGTQLAELAINLRKADKPDLVEEALQVAETLIFAVPDELDSMAADLAQALIQVNCSGVSVEGEEGVVEERQRRSLVALLGCSPLQTVSVLTSLLFSQHVDASQRILILDVMADGAKMLASSSHQKKFSSERTRRLVANEPEAADPWNAPANRDSSYSGAGPWVEVSTPLLGAGSLVGWNSSYERELPPRLGQKSLGRSRRWGRRAMELRKEEIIGNSNLPRRNEFAPLAAAFMLPVMRDYDRKGHGLDLLGRDFIILGGILSMLGVCMECISMQREAVVFGTGLLEMLRSREIYSHPEAYVRRAALFAASCVLRSLHPSDVAASLGGGMSGIVAHLEWVREWALETSSQDIDRDCCMIAMACVQLHSEMALEAQRAISSVEGLAPVLEATGQSTPSIILSQ